MSRLAKWLFVVYGIVAVAALVFVAIWVIRWIFNPADGPVIIVTTDPGDEKGFTQYGAIWEMNCHSDTGIPVRDLAEIPARVLDYHGAESVLVYKAADLANPLDAEILEIKYEGGETLRIEHPKQGNTAQWNWRGNQLKGTSPFPMPYWPRAWFGRIVGVEVTPKGGLPKVTMAPGEFAMIRMQLSSTSKTVCE